MSRPKGSTNKPKGDVQLPLPLTSPRPGSGLSNPSADGLRPASGLSTLSGWPQDVMKHVDNALDSSKDGGLLVNRKSGKKTRARSTGPTTGPLKSKVSTADRQKDRQDDSDFEPATSHYLPNSTANLLISWDKNNSKFICTSDPNSGIRGTGKSEMSALGDFVINRARVMKGDK